MFVSEYFGLGDEFDKKEIFDCILDKDSPFFINLMRFKLYPLSRTSFLTPWV